MNVNMFYFWNKGSKNVQNFFIPNFQIVFISVFSAPRTLIAIFCLFSCFLLVIQSHTGIGLAAWGACTGPFSFSCYVLLGPRPHLQLSSAKETNTADTVEVGLESTCVVGNCRCGSTLGRPRTIQSFTIWQHEPLDSIPNLMFRSTAQKLSHLGLLI